MSLSSDQLTVLHQGPVATVCYVYVGGIPVALKVFPAKLDRRTLAAYQREQAALRQLPGDLPILRPEGIEQLADGRHTVRMELCAQSLTALLGQVGTLPTADVLTLGHAIARALAAAHGAGLAHGGLTPDNVLFRASGQPVVSDFGVALRAAFARDVNRFIEFFPPEAIRSGTVDAHADLYALGALMHLALTGAPPHPSRLGEPPGARVLRILDEPVPALHRADVPVALSTVVARLLTADPAHRPRDANAIAEQLAVLRTPPQPAPPPAPQPVPPPAPQPVPEPVPQPLPPPLPQPVPSPAPQPVPEPVPQPMPQPAAVPEPEPVAADAFDDFDPAEPQPEPEPESQPEPVAVPAHVPAPVPVATGPSPHRPRWTERIRREHVLGGVAIAALMAVGLILLMPTSPPELDTTPQLPPVPPVTSAPVADAAQLALAQPTDLGSSVVLTWTSSDQLDFAVIIAEQGEPDRTLLAYREHTMTVPVDPQRKYCFLVQGTNGSQVYQSAPQPVRGATCHL